MENSNKRKRNVVTIEMKLRALERIDNGEPVHRICTEFNVGKSTVNDWRKNRKSLQDFGKQINTESVLARRHTMKKPKNESIDDALWIWYMQEQQRCTPPSGPVLKEKAMQLHKKINNGEEFLASDGWLTRWKKRHGVHSFGVCGEKASTDQTAASEFYHKFFDVIQTEKLTLEQIYKLDQTGFNCKLLPAKTQEALATGSKTYKERITVALCANAAGTHKLPLFVVGKSAKPRGFKNVNLNTLPVYYKGQRSAWMDSSLFEEWFSAEFVPKVKDHLTNLKLPLKAILVLYNAAAHPINLSSDNIKVIFLPPGITPLVQPTYQGTTANLKKRYRRKLFSEILRRTAYEGTGLTEALQRINVRDVIDMLASAFDEMTPSTFVKSWRILWPDIEKLAGSSDLDEVELTDEDSNALVTCSKQLSQFKDLEERDIDQWLTGDSMTEGGVLNDDEILEVVIQEGMPKEEEQENSEATGGNDNEERISHAEGKKALEIAMRYIEQQSSSSGADTVLLKKWCDFAVKQELM